MEDLTPAILPRRRRGDAVHARMQGRHRLPKCQFWSSSLYFAEFFRPLILKKVCF